MIEFTIYNAETCPQQTGTRWKRYKNLTIRSQGSIAISRMSAEDLGLTSNHKIVFLQDGKYPTDWYIKKATDDFGYELKQNRNGSLSFISYPLSRAIINSTIKTREPFLTISFPLILTDYGLALDINHYKITSRKK